MLHFSGVLLLLLIKGCAYSDYHTHAEREREREITIKLNLESRTLVL